ncbi:MAG: 4-hydroxy-3-methylbut-2-enyl diphosphate reductase [Bacteroidota bacterium]|nr:4-hydroxy-3-methylbut-2-enyl diphosphate reductase [Bacteroidota bacterium]
MKVTIDPQSGFCFGVVYAIEKAEKELVEKGSLYCLGDIVHNNREVNRLKELGLVIIEREDLLKLKNTKILIRAHGEPPETYHIARDNNIELIDASCPIVLNLQNDIRHGSAEMLEKRGQIVIYGKEGHAEVNGLLGQTKGTAIVINHEKDLAKIDFTKPVRLYSQTTMSVEGFRSIVDKISQKMKEAAGNGPVDFIWQDSICRQVSNRSRLLKIFASQHNAIVFVTGTKSSNGMFLFEVCKSVNPSTFLVSSEDDLNPEWFRNVSDVGVCGATSTPMWLMEKVAECIREIHS